MYYRYAFLAFLVFGAQVSAQEALPTAPGTQPAVVSSPLIATFQETQPAPAGGMLAGNHNFPNFIGFMSNPLQSIDPRAVTAIYPIFGSGWTSAAPPIPTADFQLFGAAVTVALSDRFAMGLNQGGYAIADLHRNPIARERLGRFRDVELNGDRYGLLNLGGFFQYTLIEDVSAQFLLTGGLRWEAPCGSHDVFQGHGPMHLTPYFTFGKELGEFHFLGTSGYHFPAGPGNDTLNAFYANVHFDRRVAGWLYPLVEFNIVYHTRNVDFDLPAHHGFFDFNNFEVTGNILTMAVGANAVLVPERLELGAVYTTSLATQHNFDVDGLLVKMMLRY